jgi:hypothetical protein
VNGTVEGDLLAAGGQVLVRGEVNGDARASGGQVRVTGSVGEDLIAAGGRVQLSSRGRLGGDLIFASGTTTIAGDVAGSVLGTTGDYNNTGDVGGSEKINVAQREKPTTEERVLDAVRDLITLLLVGLLIISLAPRVVGAAERTLRSRWPVALGVGVLSLFGLILGLVVLIVILGLLALVFGLLGFGPLTAVLILLAVLAVFLVVVFLVVLGNWVAPTLVSVWLVQLVLRRPAGSRRWPVEALALGALVLTLLGLIPVLEWLVDLLVFFLGLGVLALLVWGRMRRKPAAV